MPGSPGFKKCLQCQEAIPISDGHSRCVRCLGYTHVSAKCGHCEKMTARARKDRELRLRVLLFNKALQAPEVSEPHSAPPEQAPKIHGTPSATADKPGSSGYAPRLPAGKAGKGRSSSAPTAACPKSSAPTPKKGSRAESVPATALMAIAELAREAPAPGVPAHARPQPAVTAPTAPSIGAALGSSVPGISAPDAPPPQESLPVQPPAFSFPGDQAAPSLYSAVHVADVQVAEASSLSAVLPQAPPQPACNASVPTKTQQKTARVQTPSITPDSVTFSPGPDSPTSSHADYRRRIHCYTTSREPYYRSTRHSSPRRSYRDSYSRSPSCYYRRSLSPRSPRRTDCIFLSHIFSLYDTVRRYSRSPCRSRRDDRCYHECSSRSSHRRRYSRSRSPQSSRHQSPHGLDESTPYVAPPSSAGDLDSQYQEDKQDHTPLQGQQSPDSPAQRSSSSPDDAVVPADLSPTEDHKQFQELFKRVAQSQDIQTTDVQQKQHRLLKNLQPSQKSKLAFPFDDAILEVANDIWQTPATSLPTNKRSDKKYFITQKDMEFLFTHPQPNSLVVDAEQQRIRTSQTKNSSNDKEAKRLDILVRKVYSSSTSALRMCNFAAQLANHDFNNYSKLVLLFEHLPDSKHQILKVVIQEGYTVTRIAL
nr:SH3 domain-containing protein C23A1.17-like [Pelodiscus sinensis]|eukprot:XP_025035698.1 SH3 domain-containing protein C23A1.17-like [Pelodiscus sinensis]